MRESDRGQSELLGFLLIFSVVILTIALVGTTGFVGLNNAQDFQRTTNAEHGFTALANNVHDVARRGAPSRNTEIRIADASLHLQETEEINVTIDDGAAANTTTVQVQPIVYDSGSGTTIAYSSGALVRQDEDSSVMFRQPDFVLTDEAVILPIVDTSPAGVEHVGGSTAVGVEARSNGTDVVAAEEAASGVTVTIEVTSPRVDAWARYLDSETDADCAVDGDTVECEIDPDSVYVTVERVDVRLR